ILQALAEQSRVVRLPLNKIGTINKIKRTSAELEQKFEREPLHAEIAELMEISEEDVRTSVRYTNRHVSMDAPIGNDEDSGNLYDLIKSDSNPFPDFGLVHESLRSEIDRALECLSARESEVIKLFYGLKGAHALTLEEIGQEYSLTRER